MAIVLTSTADMPYPEWLEWRKKGIGGSDVSVICGINKYKSPLELWLEKTGQLPPKEAGEAAYWGKRLENFIRDEFTARTGIEVLPVNEILQSEEQPFMLANLDGKCRHPIYGDSVFEAKTANAYKLGEWDDKIPDEYMLQVQHYLAVTGYAGAYVAVLIGGNTFKWKFIERDEELIQILIKLESEFWGLVQSNQPPLLDGSDASAKFLTERYPVSKPNTRIVLPDEAVGLIEQYKAADEKVKQYAEQKQLAENLLKEMLGDCEAGVVGSHSVIWASRGRCRRFSVKETA